MKNLRLFRRLHSSSTRMFTLNKLYWGFKQKEGWYVKNDYGNFSFLNEMYFKEIELPELMQVLYE